MSKTIPTRLTQSILEFCRFARTNGLSTGVKETIDSLDAVQTIGIASRETLKFAFRAILCSSKEEWELFDDLFEAFWKKTEFGPHLTHKQSKPETSAPESKTAMMLRGQPDGARPGEDGGQAVWGASAHERLRKTDFSQIQQNDLPALEEISLRLLKQMSLRLSRRLKTMKSRTQVDLRRTIRRNISRGGDPIELHYKEKKLQQSHLVILLDISGSMNPYSLFLVRFAYALQKHFKRVDTFLFSTQLAEITGALKTQRLSNALQALSLQAAGWSGGTKIGESLRDLGLLRGKRLLTRNTLLIVLSDGWDTGEPEILATELAIIKRRVRKLIWLNPLLGMEDYQPITRGMSAALPHIDVFAPAHNLESLLQLEKHLKYI
jgi:uncharacterized protein with von Willebrand factor type A (vWA) domain